MIDRGSWAEVDLAALRRNFEVARGLAGSRTVIGVVKADAYGHGAETIARVLVEAGCRRLAVVGVAEGVALRDAGVEADVLVMGGIESDEEARCVVERGLTPALHRPDQLDLLAGAARPGAPVDVEVEVDTGMSRMGIAPDAAPGFLAAVAARPALNLRGTYTHFACADAPDPSSALAQLERFRSVLDAARAAGVDPGCVHAANSAGLLAAEHLDAALPGAGAVRPGVMLYGVRPAAHLRPDLRLDPVLHVRARVVALRDIPAGAAVGYGSEYRATAPTRVATLAIGYADGVHRRLSGRGGFWLGGARRRILGRVSMDYVGVDVTGADVGIGDVATFFGAPDVSETRVESVARDAGTSGYELLTSVGARLPRRFTAAR